MNPCYLEEKAGMVKEKLDGCHQKKKPKNWQQTEQNGVHVTDMWSNV